MKNEREWREMRDVREAMAHESRVLARRASRALAVEGEFMNEA
jgi:hypothetical protein